MKNIQNERILRFRLAAQNELGQNEIYSLIIQLTGRSANLFLLDGNDLILDSLRENSGEGQEIADKYSPPTRPNSEQKAEFVFTQNNFTTLSDALDFHYLKLESEKLFQSKAKSAEANIKKEIKKRENLVKKLNKDLENHGDAENWKRFGDLILANLANAERRGDKIIVTDYFDDEIPKIEIESDVNLSLTEAAEKFFKQYTKARNAKEEISKRLAIVHSELEKFYLRKRKNRNCD